jgi:succinate dehydrogenase / fumarate reductase cytochrome b subunit
MAWSGIAIVGFVVAHLYGTLKIFLGAEETDGYGEALREFGGDLFPHSYLLWILRIGLILAFIVHIHAAFSLDLRNRRARGDSTGTDLIAATYASRTMLWSGIVVGLFIVFHVADLSCGRTGYDYERGSVYANQIETFNRPGVTAIYLAGVAAMTLHLQHGFWSLFQTLGVSANAVSHRHRRILATALAVALGVGYAVIPVAVLTGIID